MAFLERHVLGADLGSKDVEITGKRPVHTPERQTSAITEKASVPVTSLYAISWVGNPEKPQKQPDCLGRVVWKYCYQDPRVPGVKAWVLEILKSSATVLNWMIKEKTKQGDIFILVKNIWKREK